ncbi:MAG: hypothetical protein EBU52_01370 [Cytophagia bacterium]|nr:hypothetical protein [Cytophagia bacterium]
MRIFRFVYAPLSQKLLHVPLLTARSLIVLIKKGRDALLCFYYVVKHSWQNIQMGWGTFISLNGFLAWVSKIMRKLYKQRL